MHSYLRARYSMIECAKTAQMAVAGPTRPGLAFASRIVAVIRMIVQLHEPAGSPLAVLILEAHPVEVAQILLRPLQRQDFTIGLLLGRGRPADGPCMFGFQGHAICRELPPYLVVKL